MLFSIVIFNIRCHPELDSGSVQITMKALISKQTDAETAGREIKLRLSSSPCFAADSA